ncbi:unnamed protein product [Hermetia illucens]|uniref:Major facilitator superfamily (MFS) profile domain-containing protein n=1 Tax=Hermetia illucens TaxID=343691 RepID=A0A7R8V5H0_HERIL|nr:facilitated trehalose transporter Tret1-like [Hermetia illucens]XP_037923255.1 facilitated trehalose transporter Tret1-like [Hermetia illucens]XP_037923256.1 facilitated trehalose transporter Tret1-like [Hermetia illucens]XP_037923257.1 facilitated trehalose transporter Tret1-like [Hermetia illucens]CAD7092819.1 unnamed protein product [Hermetia illucens]
MGKASYNITTHDPNAKKQQPCNASTENKPEVGKFRRILPQILASTAKNFLLFDLGLSVAFPTIVIPALRRTIVSEHYVEPLHFSDGEASWFASIPFICQPIGSIFSGWVSEPLGRKRAMIVVNIPHIIAWILLYYGNSHEILFIGAILLGLGVGFMEAPIITYVGEICEPSIRGILISCAGVAVTLGFLVVYLLGSLMDWRTAALVCLCVPVMTMVAICFVPETPMWLLSKHRKDDALKSLQWLRGWVSPKAVEKEFSEMQRYSVNSNKCSDCAKADITCPHPPPTLMEKLGEIKRKRTLKAFALVLSIFAFGQFSGLLAMRPFLVQIFKAYGVQLDPSWGTVVLGLVSVFANLSCMVFVKIIGKRKITLIGFTGCVLSCIALGSYAQTHFPANYNSFNPLPGYQVPSANFPLIMFLVLAFSTYGGVTSTPWMLLSEVFPFKARGLATGLAAGINYGIAFVGAKSYINLDKGLSLNGTMWLFTAVNILGLFFTYFFLPETENRTLEDIELHFSQNDRKLTDIKIKKNSSNAGDLECGADAKSKENQVNQENSKDSNNQKGCDNRGFIEN